MFSLNIRDRLRTNVEDVYKLMTLHIGHSNIWHMTTMTCIQIFKNEYPDPICSICFSLKNNDSAQGQLDGPWSASHYLMSHDKAPTPRPCHISWLIILLSPSPSHCWHRQVHMCYSTMNNWCIFSEERYITVVHIKLPWLYSQQSCIKCTCKMYVQFMQNFWSYLYFNTSRVQEWVSGED